MKKINVHKLGLLFLLVVCCIQLSACKSPQEINEATELKKVVVSKSDSEPKSEEAQTSEIEDVKKEEKKCTKDVRSSELTALEVVKLMGNGINLGNTMEAYGHGTLGVGATVSRYETLWGQPVTTQEMISGMKAAGFDTLRIPVAWTNAMNFESGDYTIDEDYLNRVDEIIQYGLKENMYVIINDHWDGGWWGMFGSASQETQNKAMDIYVSMWTQIAEKYKDYGNHLIFEAGNEELGDRFNDKDLCPDGNTLSKDECYELLTTVTQKFIDIVRASGGSNATRFLLIPGYNTDIQATCDSRFVMPKDTVENKLLLSVHYYTPWGYCGNASLNAWGSEKDYTEQNTLLQMMTKYTDMGYGVIIGEYAVAFNEDGSVKNNLNDFLLNFLNNCDLYGYCPILWDCNGLYKKDKAVIIQEEVAALYTERSYAKQAALTDEEIKNKAQSVITSVYEKVLAQKEVALADDSAIAWIMFNSGDWSMMYSVGDVYDPDAKTEGVSATDVKITGAGTYTVALDFTETSPGYANGTAFLALAIGNGETLYPGYAVNVTEVLINGEPYQINGKPYTSSDDKKCTRVNFYNTWIKEVPGDARTPDGTLTGTTAMLFDNEKLSKLETVRITFVYDLPK